jgi:hypothetical protein
MKAALFAAAVILGVTGCLTPFRSPADVAHIVLGSVDSASVYVQKVWLERNGGPLEITGYVGRNLGVENTTETHLDIVYLDSAGRVLKELAIQFEPREIPHSSRPPAGSASYRAPLDPLPSNTARIEVRAHDGPHRS